MGGWMRPLCNCWSLLSALPELLLAPYWVRYWPEGLSDDASWRRIGPGG